MKYLKTFENFDLGRFSDVDADEQDWLNQTHKKNVEETEAECGTCETEGEIEEDEPESEYTGNEEMGEVPSKHRIARVWGDEVVEGKKAKPDFLDLDKDGNKKESMKKAAKDAKEKDSKKEDKKEDKKENNKGLSASQKKLPPALQKAILAKKKK